MYNILCYINITISIFPIKNILVELSPLLYCHFIAQSSNRYLIQVRFFLFLDLLLYTVRVKYAFIKKKIKSFSIKQFCILYLYKNL